MSRLFCTQVIFLEPVEIFMLDPRLIFFLQESQLYILEDEPFYNSWTNIPLINSCFIDS